MTSIIANISIRAIADILAQRRDEDESGWVQLLVFLVMAVFFVISNLSKARRARKQEKEQEEGPLVAIPPLRRRPIPQPKPPASGKKIFSHKMPQAAAAEAIVSPTVEELPAVKLTAVPEVIKHKIEIPSVELTGLEKADELAKGIIYSEILGKPLALRESWGYE